MNGASNKVNHGTNGAKKRMPKYTEKGKGKGTQSRGKRVHGKGNKDLDFLDNDDGGHFGLLQHIAPSDLSQRKWVKVDLGNVVPDGLDASDFVCPEFYKPLPSPCSCPTSDFVLGRHYGN